MANGHLTIPSDPRQRREWIKYQLGLRGLSLRRMALQKGLDESTVRAALYKPYPRSERIIAQRIGVKPHELWPERYDSKGRPNRPIGRPKAHPHGDKVNTRARHGSNG